MATQQWINDRGKRNGIERIAHGKLIHIHSYLSHVDATLFPKHIQCFLIKHPKQKPPTEKTSKRRSNATTMNN